MPVIRHAETRRTETPAAVMTTLASPTQGGAQTALWRVDMGPDACGPSHVVDAEQVWTFLKGGATVDLPGQALTVHPGDTVILPAGVVREVTSGPDGFTAIVTAPAGTHAAGPDGTGRILPPWIA
ncbi:cupin domain-containing protein [Rhizohabitans arisaemae]|uniref:cupin domain-containing protein n=1 Tax=Rhizohabitans arisaemae TaxID=2720610 RepID=UPI0024B0B97B|nr:cupin [Rhizohabitans arisaemae]